MSYKEHGLSVNVTKNGDEVLLTLKAVGKLTHEDYELMVPMVDNAIQGIKHPKIKVLFDAREFEGWEARAAWDDLKFGITHMGKFTKIAFVGNKKWEEYMVKVSNWFYLISDMKFFEDINNALEWLKNEEKDIVHKDLYERKEDIQKEVEKIFKKNIRISDYNIPEANDKEAANIVLNFMQEKLDLIKKDIQEGKFDNY